MQEKPQPLRDAEDREAVAVDALNAATAEFGAIADRGDWANAEDERRYLAAIERRKAAGDELERIRARCFEGGGMTTRIGRYLVASSSKELASGQFGGTASLLWDQTGATCEQLIHFHELFATAEAAERHAIEQIELRVRDGTL